MSNSSAKHFQQKNHGISRVIIFSERSEMKLYKAEEIAEILKLPIRTIYRYGREGKLKRVKVGRHVRFVLPEMEETKC